MSEQAQVYTTSHEQLLPRWARICRALWKGISFLGTTVVISAVVGIFVTVATSPNNTLPATSWVERLLKAWPITLSLGGCILLVASVIWMASRWPLLTSSLPQWNRAVMLRQLRTAYNRTLKNTLEQNSWMDVTLFEKPDIVEDRATLSMRIGNQQEGPLPAGTSILEAYDQLGRGLLILGEPGTGKSTLLLKLAQQLVERAVSDAAHPLPVILPLSSWAIKRSSLQDWMTDKIAEIYDIPRQVSEQWVREDTILPLLDGLDEMDEAARPTRIVEINRYYQRHPVPLVVCSRTTEYEDAARPRRLALQSAVVVQPLTSLQVEKYLQQAGEPLAALRSAIKKNPALQKLATTPLMLSILMRTYHGTSVRELPKKQAVLLQEVWRDYIETMVVKKGNQTRYPLEQTRKWLIYLAQQLQARQQPIFFLEQLQPDWLPRQRKTLYQWGVGLSIGLAVGVVLGLGLALSFRLILGLVGGLIIGLAAGLFYGLSVGLRFGYDAEIKPIEVLTLKGKYLRSGLVLGFSPVPVIALAVALGLVNVQLGKLGGALIIMLAMALAYSLHEGFAGNQLNDSQKLSPNEGIRRSFKHGLLMLGVRLGCGLLFGFGFALTVGPSFGLVVGFGFGLGFGLYIGLVKGLGAAIQHYMLRFWLWRTHTFPLDLVSFLEDATTRFLLKRQFGGYSFSHQFLQDYFADLSLAKVSVTTTMPSPTGAPPA